MMDTLKKALVVLGIVLTMTSCTTARSVDTTVSQSGNTESFGSEDSQPNHTNSVNFDFSALETLPPEPNWEDFDALEELLNNSSGNIPTALFQNDGLLVVASFYSHNRSLHLCKYDQNGLVSSNEMNADIIGREHCQIIGTTDDFTIIYQTDSQELMCLQGTKIIGKGVKTSPELLEAFLHSTCWNSGFLYNNTLMFPILFKEESGISFQFYEVATNVSENPDNLFSYAYLHPFSYNLYNNELYIVENAEERLTIYNYEQEKVFAISTIVVNGDIVHVKKECISYDDMTDIVLSYLPDKQVTISAEVPTLGCQIYGNFLSKYSIDQMSSGGYFREFLLDPYDASYFCNTWQEAQEIIDFSRENRTK